MTDEQIEKLGHELCLAIRHGLYGVSASEASDLSIQIPYESPVEAINNVAGSLEKCAEMLGAIAYALGKLKV